MYTVAGDYTTKTKAGMYAYSGTDSGGTVRDDLGHCGPRWIYGQLGDFRSIDANGKVYSGSYSVQCSVKTCVISGFWHTPCTNNTNCSTGAGCPLGWGNKINTFDNGLQGPYFGHLYSAPRPAYIASARISKS